jgi:putative ABC transport system permease protein
MDKLRQDIRYSLRMLKKSPGFAAVAIITLALGIGANTAMFSVVKAILLEPLDYKDADRLVMLNHYYAIVNVDGGMSAPGYVHYRDNNSVFENVAALADWTANLTGSGEPERLLGARVSFNFFDTLEATPMLGRVFTAEEDSPGKNQVVVLSYSLWQSRFGGDASILHKDLLLNGRKFAVVGILPKTFRYGREFNNEYQIYVPVALTPAQLADEHWTDEFLDVGARLKPGVTIDQARADMDRIVAGLQERLKPYFPSYMTEIPFRIKVRPLKEEVVGNIRPALLVLFAAVGFVLLIACANVANLLLARAASREREAAIRAAVGGGRYRIVRQFLTESLILAFLGGSVGLILALWGVDAIQAVIPQGNGMFGAIPRVADIRVDARVLAFTFLLSVLTGLIFGIFPALRLSKCHLQENIKESWRQRGRGRRFHNILIVSEIGIALVVLIGSGLMVQSFRRVQHVDPGFDPNDLLVFQVSLPPLKFNDPGKIRGFMDEASTNIRGVPGIRSAAVARAVPFADSDQRGSFFIEGRPVSPDEEAAYSERWFVGDDYFQTMRIPIRGGRSFTADDNEKAPLVTIIDDLLARKYFPHENPIGKRIAYTLDSDPNKPQEAVWRTIVGVVGHIKHRSLEREDRPQGYLPERQLPQSTVYFAARTAGKPAQFVSSVREAIRRVDPDLPVFRITNMITMVANSQGQRRLATILMGIFAGIAVVLASVGLYGVMSYGVAQRTHEIGIRMAIGAVQQNVLRMIVGQAMQLVVAGLLVGIGGALVLTRLMSTVLFGVSATDPLTFVAVSVLLITCALVASLFPARRATLVDPIVALRYE